MPASSPGCRDPLRGSLLLAALPGAAAGAAPADRQELPAAARDPRHGSLQLKRVGRYWSARVGLDYRALAVPVGGGLLCFWMGPHAAYERTVRA